jgi:hypothetical protein
MNREAIFNSVVALAQSDVFPDVADGSVVTDSLMGIIHAYWSAMPEPLRLELFGVCAESVKLELQNKPLKQLNAKALCGRRLLVRFFDDGSYGAEEIPEKAHVWTLEHYQDLLEKTGYSMVPTAAVEAMVKALDG